MHQLAPQQLAAWLADPQRDRPTLLDVREAWEVKIAEIPGSIKIPMHQIVARVNELDQQRDTVVICHHGGRSMQVAYFLARSGFHNVYNLAGGVDGWARTVDPSMKRY